MLVLKVLLTLLFNEVYLGGKVISWN